MNVRIFTALLCFLPLIPAGSPEARSINDAIGKTSFSWLKAMPDAGIAATGECMAARDGIPGVFVHPAAIAGLDESIVKLSYVAHYVDTQYGSVGYARRFKDKYVGLRLTYVNYGDFARTNKQGERIGSFSAGDMSIAVNAGKMLRDDLKVGVTLSFLSSKIEEFNAQAFAADIGAIYKPPFEGLTVGAALMNVGAVTKSYSEGYDETLPALFLLGARKSLTHAPVTLMADAIFPNDNDIVYAFGIEMSVRDVFFVRAGTKSRSDIDTEIMKADTDYSGIATFGFGIDMKRYKFNYAFCPNDELEDVHKVTIGIIIP